MARRSRGRFAAVLILLALAAGSCSDDQESTDTTAVGQPPTSQAEPSVTSSTTTPTSSTITLPPTTTLPTPATLPPAPDTFSSEVIVPDGEGKFPAVVLVHGGAWVVGSPVSIEPLAIYLGENGFLTLNATYQLSLQMPGFPGAVDDIACAVRFAASHPRSDGSVTVIGHSAGAHIGALVALDGDQYGDDCPYPGTGVPDRFIGLAGPYDISRLGQIMVSFFGSAPDDDPEAWAAGNPLLRAGDNPNLRTLLIHGDADQVVPFNFSEEFHASLIDAGGQSEIILMEAAEHSDVKDPSVVGELILEWLRNG